ncbi:ClpX C4-type zinc finger protein [Pectobacterium versatile]|uniref:ClpX C4-type zinc finger protein n=1 Tax=Pectobacterium versatile TaxID=2488639 RepID=UPI00301AB04F
MKLVTCSFCGKNQGEVTLIIQSQLTNAAICSECSALCVQKANKKTLSPITVRGVDVQKDGPHYGKETGVQEAISEPKTPYRLSEKSVFDMWVGVKKQAENALDFLFATAATETHKKKGALSKWIVVVYEGQVCFERFGDGVTLESYSPVTPAKAAIYATAIVNGFQPPASLHQCDKSTD